MGYSSGFLRGILSLWIMVVVVGVLVGAVNELFDLGLFSNGYPVVGSAEPGGGSFGAFAIEGAVVVAVALVMWSLVDRLNGGQ